MVSWHSRCHQLQCQHPLGATVHVLVVPLLLCLPANGPGRAAVEASAWASTTHVGDQNGVSGVLIWAGPVPAVVVVWGVNQ